jgi:GntP family gluconate:H+ symporter
VPVPAPPVFGTEDTERAAAEGGAVRRDDTRNDDSRGDAPAHRTASGRQPSFAATVATVLLPVVLMLGKALADVVAEDSTAWAKTALDFIGTPLIALLAAVVVGLFTLGRPAGMGRAELSRSLEQALPPIAGVVLIVGAGGGFKQVLVDSGIGEVITDFAKDSGISVLLLGWLVAVLVRLATGSATVATVTASGIMAPLVESLSLSTGETSLLVLAIGSGSLIFSHVNDAGFWLIKELFRIDVADTLRTWSVMETIIAVVGLVLVLLVGLVV